MSEAIVLKPWQGMQMDMEDFLSGCLAICQEQVDALRLQTRSANSRRESLCRSE